MKIAVLAWGSLVWDPRELKTAAAFAPNGPLLPIEFCRISADGRLTLVIDKAVGDLCRTYSAPSVFTSLDAAIENLRERETRHAEDIGFAEPASGRQSDVAMERHPEAVASIAAWAAGEAARQARISTIRGNGGPREAQGCRPGRVRVDGSIKVALLSCRCASAGCGSRHSARGRG